MLSNDFIDQNLVFLLYKSNKRLSLHKSSCILTFGQKSHYLSYKKCFNIIFIVRQISEHNFD